MRILLTGASLSIRAGHDPVSRQLARVLQARGHIVMASGSHPNQVPRTMEIDWIPVVSEPWRLELPPDIIHACHPHDAFWALAALPGVPAVLQTGGRTRHLPCHPRIYRRLHRVCSPGKSPEMATGKRDSFNPDQDVILPEDEEMLGAKLEEVYLQVTVENRNRPIELMDEAGANLAYLEDLFPRLMKVDELNPITFPPNRPEPKDQP